MKKLMRRLIWFIPVIQGIMIGFMLWLSEGMNVSVVLPQWIGIAVILVAYIVLIRRFPVSQKSAICPTAQPNKVQVITNSDGTAETVVQTHYKKVVHTHKKV